MVNNLAFRSWHRLVLTLLFLATLSAINFEAVFAIPLYFIRSGAKLKISDLLAMLNTGIFGLLAMFYLRVPKSYIVFFASFTLLLVTGIFGPAIFRSYMFISAIWFFLSFTSAYLLYDFLQKETTAHIIKLLSNYLTIANVLYSVAFLDYVFTTIFRQSIFPPILDQRMHQLALGVFRFEGFSPLSLAYMPIGFFHFMIALLLRRRFSATFHLGLILLGISIGGMVAGVIAYLFFIYGRLSAKTKFLLLVPVLVIGFVIINYLVALKIQSAGKWSYGVRLELYALTPTILENDYFGMGFGQSRYLYYSAVRYNLNAFETLYNKANIERTFVVESSFLEVIYEFGYLGLAMCVFYTLFILRLIKESLKKNIRNMLIPAAIMLFLFIHGFLNPSYFYQTKFWLYNFICLVLIGRFGYPKTFPDPEFKNREALNANARNIKQLNNG